MKFRMEEKVRSVLRNGTNGGSLTANRDRVAGNISFGGGTVFDYSASPLEGGIITNTTGCSIELMNNTSNATYEWQPLSMVGPFVGNNNITYTQFGILTSPTAGQYIQWNGSSLVNATLPTSVASSFLIFSSQGNLSNGNYLKSGSNGLGGSSWYEGAVLLPRNCTILSISLAVAANSPTSTGWEIALVTATSLSGATVTSYTCQCLGTTLYNKTTVNLAMSASNFCGLYLTEVNGATITEGVATIEYV